MNLIYEVTETQQEIIFKYYDRIKLLGCNQGLIPKLLKKTLIRDIELDTGWSLDITGILENKNRRVVIDLKPSHKSEVFLVELTHVYGFNHSTGWTALLYRFKTLINSVEKDKVDTKNFVYDKSNSEIIYSFLYALGFVMEGKIEGRWLPPFGSMTGLLMWRKSYDYFEKVMKADTEYKVL